MPCNVCCTRPATARRPSRSAEAFLSAGGAQGAHCLVLDVQLPGASGIELYARLGSDRPAAVFISSHDSPKLRSAAARAGGAAVLPKPCLGHELTDAIALAIGQGGLP